MSLTFEQLAKEAENLPPSQREELLRRLIIAADQDVVSESAEVGAAWDAEIQQRITEIDSGQVETIPAAEVFSKLKAKRSAAKNQSRANSPK